MNLTPNDALTLTTCAGAYHLPDLLHGSIWRTFGRVREIISDLIVSPEEKYRQVGARLIAVAAISPRALTTEELEFARGVVDMLIERGHEPHKTAIAHVLARNVDDSEADYCFDRLLPLTSDPDEKVRGAVSQVFDEMTAAQFITRFEWLQAYVASPALPRGLHQFGDYLMERGGVDASRGLTLITAALDNTSDPDQHRWFDGRDFIQFALRVDTDPTYDTTVKRAAMDIFDRLMERYGDFAESILEQWDRR
jgi:hypothetical protein